MDHCTARSRQLIEHEGEEISIPSLIEPVLSPVCVSLDESQAMLVLKTGMVSKGRRFSRLGMFSKAGRSKVGIERSKVAIQKSKAAIGTSKIRKIFNIGNA